LTQKTTPSKSNRDPKRRENLEALAEILESQAALAAKDPVSRVEILLELGDLYETKLSRADAAGNAYARAFQANPAGVDALDKLRELYFRTENWSALRIVLEAAAAASTDLKRRADLLCELGEIFDERFGEPEHATEAFERALALVPAHLAAVRGLQRVALGNEDDEGVIAAYVREAELSRDPGRIAFLSEAIATRLEGQGQLEDALSWWQRRLETSPEDSTALDACSRLCQARSDRQGLCDVLERRAALAQGMERKELLQRLAETYEQMGRTHDAIRCRRECLQIDPEPLENWRALASVLAQTQRYAEQAEALRQVIRLETRTPARAKAKQSLATLLEQALGDPDSALEVLRELAHEAPEATVLDDVERLLASTGQTQERIQWLRDRYEATSVGSEDSRALGLRLASLLAEQAGQWDEAVRVYRDLYEKNPQDAEISVYLETALHASGDSCGLVEHLKRRVEAESDPYQQCKLQFELAETLCSIGNTEMPFEELLTQLADQAPDDEIAERAGVMLLNHLEHTSRWEALYQRLLLQIEATTEGAQHVELLERCSQLCIHRRHDPESALMHLEQAVRYAPERVSLWQALAALAQGTGRMATLLAALEGELDTNPERTRAICLHEQAAALCSQQLRNNEGAQAHWAQLLELEPTHLDGIEWMAKYLQEQGDVEKRIALLERSLEALASTSAADNQDHRTRKDALVLELKALLDEHGDGSTEGRRVLERAMHTWGASPALAEALVSIDLAEGNLAGVIHHCQAILAHYADPGIQARWTLRLGETFEALQQEASAIAAYREVCRLLPDEDAPLLALENLHRKRGEREPLARILQSRLEGTMGPAEIPLRLELAEILSAPPFERFHEALVHLRRVLELDEACAQARQRGIEIAAQCQDADQETEFLDCALRQTSSPTDKVDLMLRKSILLADKLERKSEAIAVLRQALTISPNAAQLQTQLATLYREQGCWKELLSLVHLIVANPSSLQERSTWLTEAVNLSCEHAPDQALGWLERLRRERPEDLDVLLRIAEQHRRAQRPTALLHTLAQATTLAASAEERTALILEQVRVLEEQMHAPSRALQLLRRAKTDGIETLEVVDAHARIAAQLGFGREAVDSLEALCAQSEGEHKRDFHIRAAHVYGAQLDEHTRAAQQLRAALLLEQDTGNQRRKLLQQLGSELRAAGGMPDWIEVAEEELRTLEPNSPVFYERRLFLHFHLGQAYRLSLSDDHAALRHFRTFTKELDCTQNQSAQSTQANQPPALIDASELESIILGLLRRTGNLEELAQLLQRRLKTRPDAPDEWLELGQLAEEVLHQPSLAATAYRNTLGYWPDSRIALHGIRRSCELLGDWERVAWTLETEIGLLAPANTEQRASFFRRLGEIAWKNLKSTTRASRAFAAALEASPQDLLSLHALQELFEAMEDWRGAVDLYASEIDLLGDGEPARTRELWLHIAQLAEDHLDDLHRARRALEAAHALEPLSPMDCAKLASFYETDEHLESFAAFYTMWCDSEDSRVEVGDHLRLAHALETLGQLEAALTRLERARKLAPEDDPLVSQLWLAVARIHEAREERELAAWALVHATAGLQPAQAVVQLQRASALVEASQPEQALEWLEHALEIDPASTSTYVRIARVSVTLERFLQARDASVRALDLGRSDGSLPNATCFEVAHIGAAAARAAGELGSATELYGIALEIDPARIELVEPYAEALIELEEFEAARHLLEAHISLTDTSRAHSLALLGFCSERLGDTSYAQECYRAALEGDAADVLALEGMLRLYEAQGNDEAALALLDRLSTRIEAGERRSSIFLIAARLERERDPASASIESKLREAIAVRPNLSAAWVMLCEYLLETKRYDELATVSQRGIQHASSPEERGLLNHLLGVGLEAMSELEAAAKAYAQAQHEDRTRIDDALAGARIQRTLGSWSVASELLERACEAVDESEPNSATLGAQLFLQLGRLRAGPLELIEGAIKAYRKALDLDPKLLGAREALAQILVHHPRAWKEAIERHRELLHEDPTRDASLYAIVTILRERKRHAATLDGLAILRAVGALSPRDREDAPENLSLRLGVSTSLEDPLAEKARRILYACRQEIALALDVHNQSASIPEQGEPADGETRFSLAALSAEGDLAAPALVLLDDEEVRGILRLICHLSMGAEHVEGEGTLVNDLAGALARRTQRRVRRILGETSLDQIDALDIASWRKALRDQAYALAFDRTSRDLRSALKALIQENSQVDGIVVQGDIRALVRGCPAAYTLLEKAVMGWIDNILRD